MIITGIFKFFCDALPAPLDYWAVVSSLKNPSPSYSGSNSSPEWIMSLSSSALFPLSSIKPHVIAARTVSQELLGGGVLLSRDMSESLPTLGGSFSFAY